MNNEISINTVGCYISFWGGVFSNWAPTPFENEDGKWSNSEQYFMWLKAKFFGDDSTAEDIECTSDPQEAKKLGVEPKQVAKKLDDMSSHNG